MKFRIPIGGLLGGSAVSLAARMVFVLAGIVTTSLTAIFYGASTVGTVATITTLITLGAIVANLGTSSSVSYYVPSQLQTGTVRSARRSYRRVVNICILGSCLTGALFAAAGGMVIHRSFEGFSNEISILLLVLCILGVPLRVFSDLSGYVLRALDNIPGFAITIVMPALVTLLGLVGTILLGEGWMGAVWALIGGLAVTAVVGSFWVARRFRAIDDGLGEPQSPKSIEILRHSLPMLMSTVGAYVITGCGVLIVAAMGTQVDVGIYSVALRVASVTSLILTAVNSITAPMFARLHSAGKESELVAVARQACRLTVTAVVPLSIVLLLFGRQMLDWVFGREFEDAYLPMMVLLLGQMVNAFTGSSDFVLNMAGMQRALRNIIAPAAVICVLLSIILMPSMGILGVSFAYVISLTGWNLVAAIVLRRRYGAWLLYIPMASGISRILRRSRSG